MSDVPRWTADGSHVPDGVREIFRSANVDGPAEGQADALWAKLQPLLGPGGGGPDGSGGGPGVGAPDPTTGQGGDVPAPVGDATSAATAAASTAASGAAATWLRPLVTAVVAGIAISSSAVWVAETRPGVAPHAKHESVAVIASPDPRAALVPEEPMPEEPMPEEPMPEEPMPAPAPTTAGVEPKVSVRRVVQDARVTEPTESEAAYLQRAYAILRAGDPAKALMMAREHSRIYEHPALGQEREIIVVQALVDLGRRPEAIAHAQAFLDRYPSSAHARRLRAILGLPEPGESNAEEKSHPNVIIPDASAHSQPERLNTGETKP